MLQIMRRLFLPVTAHPGVSLKLLLESALGSFWFDVIPLFSIPYAILLVQDKKYDDLFQFSLIIFGVYVVLWVVHLFTRQWDFQAKYAYQNWVEENFRKKIILKDNLSMDVLGTGKVQSLVQKGMHDWVEAVWQIFYQIPRVVLSLVTGVFIMKNFGLVFIIFFFLYIFISSFGFTYFRKVRLKYDRKINELEDDKNAHSVRVIMSRQEIIFSGKENLESKQLSDYGNKQFTIARISAKYDYISDWFISGIGTVLPFLGIMYVINTGLRDTLTVGVFVSFIYFASHFTSNMYSLLWIVRQTLEHLPKIQKFWDFLDHIPELKNYEKGKTFVHGNGAVEFENVTLQYDQEFLKNKFFEQNGSEVDETPTDEQVVGRPILENFNLKIEGGSKLALVGRSGSGKTTIAKLVVGYLKASSGQVLVDGQDLAQTSLKSYYRSVGYLTQEPNVFDGSIKDNLLYAIPDKKNKTGKDNFDAEIKEALEKANCDFVFKMKKGINTQIGEKGVRLSGGERQRLAIAKLFIKNPEIIILDEPTSALDSFSEDTISKSLEELFKNRTTIIIAHRLQTVKSADRILVIDNGKIVEDGNHDSLVEKNGVYAKMLAMQSGF
jgi:ATP-binding cassette subfamily B protein